MAILSVLIVIFLIFFSVVILPFWLFRRENYGIRLIQSVYYTLKSRVGRVAPHELRSDLIYWEKDDYLKRIADSWDDYYDKWKYGSVTFKGFLENSIVIQEDGKLKELSPGSFIHYENDGANRRIAELETIKLEARLKGSAYGELIETMQEQNREIKKQMKELTQ